MNKESFEFLVQITVVLNGLFWLLTGIESLLVFVRQRKNISANNSTAILFLAIFSFIFVVIRAGYSITQEYFLRSSIAVFYVILAIFVWLTIHYLRKELEKKGKALKKHEDAVSKTVKTLSNVTEKLKPAVEENGK